MKRLASASTVIVFGSALALSPAARAEMPAYVKQACKFPAGYKIGAKTPPQYRDYVGIYTGNYVSRGIKGVHHTWIVTDISTDGKSVGYYVVDNFSPWRISRACTPITGRFRGGAILFGGGSGRRYEYKLTATGGSGTRWASANVSTVALTKQPTPPEWMSGK